MHNYASVWQRVQDTLTDGLSDWRQREFLKNIGYDVAKPDRHINRALGSFGWVSFRNWPDRSGTKAPTATEKELIAVMQEVARCAELVSQSACFVDNVIWVLCARSGLHASNKDLMTIGGKLMG